MIVGSPVFGLAVMTDVYLRSAFGRAEIPVLSVEALESVNFGYKSQKEESYD